MGPEFIPTVEEARTAETKFYFYGAFVCIFYMMYSALQFIQFVTFWLYQFANLVRDFRNGRYGPLNPHRIGGFQNPGYRLLEEGRLPEVDQQE